MSDNRNDFDPILNIPSIEELDRQWKEMESGRGRSTAKSTAKKQGDKVQKAKNTPKESNKKRRKRKKEKKFKKLRLFLKIFFLMLLLATLGLVVVFYVKFGDDLLSWKKEAHEIVAASTSDTFRASETSVIYAANKKPIATLRGDKDSSYLKFEDIPKAAIDCMVATEDREFYEHSGVNLLSTGKAALLLVRDKIQGKTISRGGSTITQQLAKNVFLSNEKTYERKVREMFFAMELESKYTKDEIMEFYINNICFANGHFGLEAASKAYFSKSATELNLAEIAFLCAIPNRPTYYDPLQNYANTITRKDRILEQLLQEEKITAAEYSDAKYTEIVLNPAEAIKTQNYMTTYAISCATKALMKEQGFVFQYEFSTKKEKSAYDKEYKEIYEECNSALYTGGYQIYTSLSKQKQNQLQKSVNESLSMHTSKTKDGVYQLQGAATCIDNKTGFVVAIVGGRKQKSTVGYTLNRGFQSYRQPGSCFKPLVVYTPQLERSYTPSTIVDDTYFEGGPRNSSGTYSGKIPLRRAVEQSKNVVAWKLFEELSPSVGLSYVLKMNFSQIVDSDYYPAASLGGLTNGVSTVEMASAYAALENDGVYREPTCVRKITNSDGELVINNVKKQERKQVYEENAARMMTDILEGVLIRGTASGKGLSNMPSAGKTGTTSDKKDGWFCGYTPYYTTVVWVGYDNPKTLSDLYGSTYPLTIWHNYMEQIHEGLERIEFPEYEGQEKKIEKTEETAEPTIDPDAAEVTETPKQTKAPAVTKAPVETKAPSVDESNDDASDDEPVEDIPDEGKAEDIPE